MNIKGTAGEVSEGKEKHVIGNWRKGDLCNIVAKNIAELCSTVMWKAEFVK